MRVAGMSGIRGGEGFGDGRGRARAGFTLIEVLVAFVVMGLVLAAVYRGFAMGFDALRRLGEVERRVAVAENRLAELGVTIPLAAGRYRGVEAGQSW